MTPGIRAPLCALTLFMALAAPAAADTIDVDSTPADTFSPRAVTVLPGDTVAWHNIGGFHDVVASDNSFMGPIGGTSDSNWVYRRDFPTAGTFAYYCTVHGDASGGGMAGTVKVLPPGSPRPPDVAAPRFTRAAAAGSGVFCARRSATCLSPGVRVRFTLSEDATVTGSLQRRNSVRRSGRLAGIGAYLSFGSVSFGSRDKGPNTVTFTKTGRNSGRTLTPGQYRLRVGGRDAAGNRSSSSAVTVTFFVRS